MFIRVNKTPNSPRKSIQIVESHRIGNKVKQKIVHYVGIALDEEEVQKLKDLATDLIVKIEKQRDASSNQLSFGELITDEMRKTTLLNKSKLGRPRKKQLQDIIPVDQVTLDEIVEKERIMDGIHDVGGHVFDELYGKIFPKKRILKKVRDLVLSRIAFPSSKHKTQQLLKKHCCQEHQLDSLYRAMDNLFTKIDQIKSATFNKTQSLFPQKIDLLFFDVTTLYFESIHQDDLRKFGYSKDFRFNTTQVVLALATNSDGLPIGYELFEGNHAELKTLSKAIDRWQKNLPINQVCFVADRAMFTKDNLKLLEEKNYQFIVAAKLRTLTKSMQNKILDEKNYQTQLINNNLAWIGEFEHNNHRLIVSYKTKRAIKDHQDRQRILEKIQKNLTTSKNTKSMITNRGIKKFTSTKGKSETILDQDKIDKDQAWDGLHGIITNMTEERAVDLFARYARLWKIEESFRINKHTLKMRPIFHFKPERIHSHIAICYMAFSVIKYIEYQVNLTQKISIQSIIDELRHVQSSIYVHKKTEDLYRIPGKFTHQARKIYKTFSIKKNMDAEIHLM